MSYTHSHLVFLIWFHLTSLYTINPFGEWTIYFTWSILIVYHSGANAWRAQYILKKDFTISITARRVQFLLLT
jgi:hypothetical protein